MGRRVTSLSRRKRPKYIELVYSCNSKKSGLLFVSWFTEWMSEFFARTRTHTHTWCVCVDGDPKKSCASPLRGGAGRHRDSVREPSPRLYVARRIHTHTHTHCQARTLTPNAKMYRHILIHTALEIWRKKTVLRENRTNPTVIQWPRGAKKVCTVPTSSTTHRLHIHTIHSFLPSLMRNDSVVFS